MTQPSFILSAERLKLIDKIVNMTNLSIDLYVSCSINLLEGRDGAVMQVRQRVRREGYSLV